MFNLTNEATLQIKLEAIESWIDFQLETFDDLLKESQRLDSLITEMDRTKFEDNQGD